MTTKGRATRKEHGNLIAKVTHFLDSFFVHLYLLLTNLDV